MSLKRVVYISSASSDFATSELGNILTTARSRNAQREITGLLLFGGGEFMQLLEGPPLAVEKVFNRIRFDPRHREVKILLEQSDSARLFPGWKMGFIEVPGVPRTVNRQRFELLLELCRLEAGAVSPAAGQEAVALLKDFRDQLTAA